MGLEPAAYVPGPGSSDFDRELDCSEAVLHFWVHHFSHTAIGYAESCRADTLQEVVPESNFYHILDDALKLVAINVMITLIVETHPIHRPKKSSWDDELGASS